jgi:hypothetical protein
MADKKISALTSSTTPLAGTEVLPIVQSGSTVKVAVSDLTAGRAVNALSITIPNTEGATSFTGSGATIGRGTAFLAGQAELFTTGTRPLGIGTSGAGNLNFYTGSTRAFYIDTNQNLVVQTAGKGIDFSANGGDVLSQYDEGTFTPVITGSSSDPTVTYSRQRGKYVRVGNVVTISVDLIWDAISGGSGDARLSLPFAGESSVGASGAGPIAVLDGVTFAASRTFCSVQPQASVLYATLPQAGSGVSTSNTTIAQLSASGRLVLSCTYLI